MAHRPTVVIIGAGIVGCALADELTRRGWTDVTVLDQGPLFNTGGSSSHAPGLVFQTNPSRTMTRLARYTAEKYAALRPDGEPCYTAVGGLEVATTTERQAELHRRYGFAVAAGLDARLLDPRQCVELHPLLDPAVLHGGLHVPGDGLARAVPAAAAQAALATDRGAVFLGGRRVTGIDRRAGAVVGVRCGDEVFPADVVVSCAGFWGPAIGRLAGVAVPLLPMAHQYARTGPRPGLAAGAGELPILRHQDRDLYVRQHGDRLGIGSYAHRPMPVDLDDLPAGPTPSVLPFTPADFAASWQAAGELLPELAGGPPPDGINGVFSFTADGFPLLGEVRGLRGFWTAEAVWVTHSAGVARALAEWLVDGRPGVDLHECDVNRFADAQLAPSYVRERAIRSFVEVYDIVHPLDPPAAPRNLRVSPLHARQVALGAVFGEAGGWERPLWFAANAGLPGPPDGRGTRRDPWSARHFSPIVAAEALATRQRVALYDMTPLTRLQVSGPGAAAYLQRLTSTDVDRPVGTVGYALLLDVGGGVRSDVTVARLDDELFQVGVNGPLDHAWLLRHRPADGSVTVHDVTGGTCGIGVWGPAARDLVAGLADIDVSHAGFGYFTARRGHLGDVPVTMLRLSYVGELGWEIYTGADTGQRLFDLLWRAGAPLGVLVAGRGAFDSLRLEKGYRAWGRDVTAEDDPYAAGLGFAVDLDSGDFVGRDAVARLATRPPERLLSCLLLDDGSDCVPMGREPVYADDTVVGRVTSAGYGFTVGAPIAYAWLPADLAVPGTRVQIGYVAERLPATVAAEPLFDPKHTRIRR